jgi:hypothetical protein
LTRVRYCKSFAIRSLAVTDARLSPGDTAPDFTLTSDTGEEVGGEVGRAAHALGLGPQERRAASVFRPEALLREARRQKGLPASMCRRSAISIRTAISFAKCGACQRGELFSRLAHLVSAALTK